MIGDDHWTGVTVYISIYACATVRNPLVGYVRRGTPEIPPVDGPRISWARLNKARDQEHRVKRLCESPWINVRVWKYKVSFHCPWRIIASNYTKNHKHDRNSLLPSSLAFIFRLHPDQNRPEPVTKYAQMISSHWKMPETCQVSGRSWMRFHAGSWSATSSHQQTLCQQRGRRVWLVALGWACVLSTNSCRFKNSADR